MQKWESCLVSAETGVGGRAGRGAADRVGEGGRGRRQTEAVDRSRGRE